MFLHAKSNAIAKSNVFKDNKNVGLVAGLWTVLRIRSGRTNAVRWTIGSFEVVLYGSDFGRTSL